MHGYITAVLLWGEKQRVRSVDVLATVTGRKTYATNRLLRPESPNRTSTRGATAAATARKKSKTGAIERVARFAAGQLGMGGGGGGSACHCLVPSLVDLFSCLATLAMFSSIIPVQ